MPSLLAKVREETSHPPNHLFTIFSSSQMASPQTTASSVLILLFTSATRDLEQHIRQPSITAVCRAMTTCILWFQMEHSVPMYINPKRLDFVVIS